MGALQDFAAETSHVSSVPARQTASGRSFRRRLRLLPRTIARINSRRQLATIVTNRASLIRDRKYLRPSHIKGLESAEAELKAHEPENGAAIALLVVEDEPLVRAMITEYVQECGYLTFEATNAEAAKRILAGPVPIDILFSDVRLPGESGLDLAMWCRTNYPGVRILLTSGLHSWSGEADNLCVDGPLVHKPYGLGDLLRHFRALIPSRPRVSPAQGG